MTATASSRGRLLGVFSLLLLWVLIGIIALHRAGGNNNPELLDQGAYLHVSLLIQEHRGLTDGNRHPLYPAMLAPFAARDHAFFPTAKLVTLVLGMAGYLFVTWRVARRWGTGMALAVLLACASSFVWTASGLRCEVLLIPLLWVFWETGAAGFERPRLWIVAGCAAGLCYLTKASGTLLVVALVATWLFSGQLLDRRRWNLILFLAPFALVVSPLAWWNYRTYGTPFYNHNSRHVMWLDGWEQAGRVHTPLPTMQSWFAEHGLADLISRELIGFVRLPDLWLFVLFGLAAASLALRSRRGTVGPAESSLSPYEAKLAVAIVVVQAVLLAWYTPIVSSSRFVIPMQPVMWIVVLLAMADRMPRAWLAGMRRLQLPLTVLLAVALLIAPIFLNLRNPYDAEIVTYPEIEDWVRATDESALVYGPSQNFPQWMFIPDFRFVKVPPDVSFDEMLVRMNERDARFLLVDLEMFRNRPILGKIVDEHPREGLIPVPGARDLVPHMIDRERPGRWVLFEREVTGPDVIDDEP